MPKKIYDDVKLKAEALELRRKGYSYREIAEKLGCSVYKVHELVSPHESPRTRLRQVAELADKVDELSKQISKLEASLSDVKSLNELTKDISDLREEIREIKDKISKESKEVSDQLKSLMNSIEWIRFGAERRVMDDRNGCKWMDKDGYCTLWSWYERMEGYYMKPDLVDEKILYRLNVKKHPLICAACPFYKPRGY